MINTFFSQTLGKIAQEKPQYTGSVRLRIVAWMVLVTSFMIAGLIFTVREILVNEVGSKAAANTQSELAEFRTFAEIGVDPTTAAPFNDLEQMLTTFLARQYTSSHEQLIGVTNDQIIYVDDRQDFGVINDYYLYKDRALLNDITVNTKTSGVAQTPAGPVHWGKVKISINADQGTETGHLIVIEYVQPELDAVQHTIITMIWVGIGGLAATVAIAWLVASRITKPIRNLRAVAQSINDKNFNGRVTVTGDDDVAAMSHTFNQMLDRLEESTMIERQFMDDVSHELRTPITIVRGHLELMERNANQEQTLKLVDDELDRMGRIVSDLLTLAKSERPDFVSPHPVDLADLMISLDSKVQAFSDHRWIISDIAEGEIYIDEQRITQAMVQLCANAAQYSPACSTISIGSHFEGTGKQRKVNLWVQDKGPGVSSEDASKLFDRFTRKNAKHPSTAKKHSMGAGLGLAIVRSIAEAHNGSVWVAQPSDGVGAIFGITLPAQAIPETPSPPVAEEATQKPGIPARSTRRTHQLP